MTVIIVDLIISILLIIVALYYIRKGDYWNALIASGVGLVVCLITARLMWVMVSNR